MSGCETARRPQNVTAVSFLTAREVHDSFDPKASTTNKEPSTLPILTFNAIQRLGLRVAQTLGKAGAHEGNAGLLQLGHLPSPLRSSESPRRGLQNRIQNLRNRARGFGLGGLGFGASVGLAVGLRF